MRPARQGAFDGLCGVYAIMNALDLVGLNGPKGALHRNLFYQLTKGLGPAALLRGMKSGLTAGDLRRAARPAFNWLALEHGVQLKLIQPFSSAEFFDVSDFLGAVLVKTHDLEAAAIIHVRTHGVAHWTVVQSVGAKGIVLRDSWRHPALIAPERFALNDGPRLIRTAETLLLTRLAT